MAQAGRKPRPPHLQAVGGRTPTTDSGGRKLKPPPAFVRKAPAPPTWLDREARAEWKRVVPELERLKLLKGGARSSLATYCLMWSLYVDAVRDRHARGVTVEVTIIRKDGTEVHKREKNPSVAVELAASQQLRQWCAEFGLTPTAEGRLSIPEGDDGEEEADFD